jgi:AraC-like DNA-binding protein
LICYFETRKPWLDANLKITHVARVLATNRTYLSEVLRIEFKTNFKRFVNRYRVKEAKRLMAENNANIKIPEIAVNVGFNSYTTFYYAFRNETGLSPQEYAEQTETSRKH